MSRKDDLTRLVNPADQFIQWQGTEGKFYYYDKENKLNVDIELPFKFVFLKGMATIKGWNDSAGVGLFSNEVSKIGEEPLKVRLFDDNRTVIAEGLYNEIKDKILANGGKYFASVYVMVEGGLIANLQLKGDTLYQWTKMQKNQNALSNNWIVVNGSEDKKKGATKYKVPVFTIGEQITEEQDQSAEDMYNVLMQYLNQYKEDNQVAAVMEDVDEDLPEFLKD